MNEMKKFYFIATALLITLGACTNDESAPEQNEIGFNAVTRKASKALIESGTLDIDKNLSFNVWGFYNKNGDFSTATSSNFMDGIKIEWTSGNESTKAPAWRNATKYYYWPATGKIGFYALFPSTVPIVDATTHFTNGFVVENYEIKDNDGTKFQDLMYGYVAPGVQQTDKLPLAFYHALSQIEFRLQIDDTYPDAEFYVESIKINNVDLMADFSFKKPNITDWSNEKNNQTGSITYLDGTSSKLVKTATDAEAALYGSGIVMIPQIMSAATEAETQLEIEYKLIQADDTEMTGTVFKDITTEWELGKKYVYTLNFKLNEIRFEPTASEWIDIIAVPTNINE